MARPRLNTPQKTWLTKFLAQYSWYKLREVHEGSSGDRYLLLDGIERLPLPLLPEFADTHPGYRMHTLWVQLRVYGDPRVSAKIRIQLFTHIATLAKSKQIGSN